MGGASGSDLFNFLGDTAGEPVGHVGHVRVCPVHVVHEGADGDARLQRSNRVDVRGAVALLQIGGRPRQWIIRASEVRVTDIGRRLAAANGDSAPGARRFAARGAVVGVVSATASPEATGHVGGRGDVRVVEDRAGPGLGRSWVDFVVRRIVDVRRRRSDVDGADRSGQRRDVVASLVEITPVDGVADAGAVEVAVGVFFGMSRPDPLAAHGHPGDIYAFYLED